MFIFTSQFGFGRTSNLTLSQQNTPQILETVTAQKIFITDSRGKRGIEVGDTIIVVKTELQLFASLYNNGKYRREADVDWFWAGISQPGGTSSDTTIFLGSGKSIIFRPVRIDTGIIFIESNSKARDDSTGTIIIIHAENLIFSPIVTDVTQLSQGQDSIFLRYDVKNSGIMPAIIHDAGVEMVDPNNRRITNDYQVTRLDTTSLIPIHQTRRFKFLVNVNPDADTVLVSVDSRLATDEGVYIDQEHSHRWQVQSPPLLNIDLIDAFIEEVYPGQEGVLLSIYIVNHGMASVNNIQTGLSFWYGGQNVTDDYEYAMTQPGLSILKGHTRAKVDFWIKVKQDATPGIIIINGRIIGNDSNTGISYSDQGADIPASWNVTHSSSRVGIVSTKVNCPNRDEAGDGKVNIDQSFSVEVAVQNLGTDEIKNATVTLTSGGHSIHRPDTTLVIPSILTNQSQTVTFDFVASADTVPFFEIFSSRIDSAISGAGGGKAAINGAFDSLARVDIMNPATLFLEMDTTFLQVPTSHIFEMTTRITNAPGSADFDSTGTVSIVLPQGYELLENNRMQRFVDSEPVSWKVTSPAMPRAIDSIMVYISQIPFDKNNPVEHAKIAVDSIFRRVETVNPVLEIAGAAIIYPPGATDGTLSTGQDFIIQAKISKQKVDSVYIQIDPPDGYEILDNQAIFLNNDTTTTWQMRAPGFPTHRWEPFIISAWGNKENDIQVIYCQPDSMLSATTISKADLKVTAEIIGPASALTGQIYPGLEFQVQGKILNSGDAEIYGNASLILDVQDRHSFVVLGDTLQMITNGTVNWTVKTSENIDNQPKIIKVRMVDVPLDENTDLPAYFSAENKVADLQVFTATGIGDLELMVKQLPEIVSMMIAPGTSERFMGIEFSNLATENGYPIQINALKFLVEDKFGKLLTPASVISSFLIQDDNGEVGQASSLAENPVPVLLDSPIQLDPGESRKIYIDLTVPHNLSQSFRINLQDQSFIELESPLDVVVVDESRKPVEILNLRSHCPIIKQDNLKDSFGNYPNPFGTPGRELTHFIYFLPQDSDINLKIYTLIGELVWSRNYSKTQPQGKKGLHQNDDITWDGTNLRGYKVLNGVYIARLKTSTGEWAMTKVAVIK